MRKIKLIMFLFVSMFSTRLNAANEPFKTVSVEDFSLLINSLKGAQLLDVRTAEEFADRHLANAKNIDVNAADFSKNISAMDKTKPVLVYCLSGGRSAKACDVLAKQGFSSIFNMEGGITAWASAKKPLQVKKAANFKGMDVAKYVEEIKKDKVVLVDFNAVWCGPCKMLKPILANLEKQYKGKAKIWAIDVDQNPQLSAEMKIRSIPLLILYKQGKEVWRQNGFADEPTIQTELAKALK